MLNLTLLLLSTCFREFALLTGANEIEFQLRAGQPRTGQLVKRPLKTGQQYAEFDASAAVDLFS